MMPAPRPRDPDVVGAGLLAGVQREIDVTDAAAGERAHQHARRLGATIAHHDQLPARNILRQHASYRKGQHRRAIIGREHDRHRRRRRVVLRRVRCIRHR